MSIIVDKTLILNRIKSHYNLNSNAEFARFLSITPQTLASWYSRNTFDIDLLYAKCEYVSGDFLLTGTGRFERVIEPSGNEFFLKTDRRESDQQIPLYNIEASLGLTQLFNNKQEVLDYISVPNLPKCDGAIHVTGDSMYPLLKSGDIIMYKVVNDINHGIFWGEMYLLSISIDDGEYTTVKYIQKSDLGATHVKLVSQNSHHDSKDIPITSIRALAYVKASIRINSMT